MILMLAPIVFIVFGGWKITVALLVVFFILRKVAGWLEYKWYIS
jgi:hypothetical protein